ncbi:tripartite tricarboxylate transporter substrate binding protein [Bosea sp. (in: a-proteobacteria)]|uniref:Bug family tripartite tricarboxylate transporter substrate binding protein n=1 Tax=Bosea sp. (in: a-proteobacteria) TaxID=1871050 RepID=UPI0025B806A2|nr:tripartite tricarboxylate transporter substrate binding protein [Bosea sp. (in: a-proteobacteria)]MBR3189890.1 tripartite tricarboxylate transporter substrate binding protein [Bosea sp. (in: a-proteobacteria)]
MKPFKAALAAIALVVSCLAAAAQAPYPSAPVRIIVPFAAGGASDLVARTVAERLQALWGQGVVIENIGGGGSNIGVAALARAKPDGYTLGLINASSHGMNKWLYKEKLAYDPLRDFAPVSQLAITPNVLVVNPEKVPAKTVPEFIALLKQKPNALNFGSSGVGTSLHVGMELFQQTTGTKLTHVPYRGSGPMMVDLLSGQLDVALDGAAVAWPYVEAGKLRALATSIPQRASFLPDLPALSEFLPGFDVTAWHGLAAPAGTPKEIVEKVSRDVRGILETPEIRDRLATQKIIALGMTPDAFRAFIEAEIKKWEPVVEKAQIRIE